MQPTMLGDLNLNRAWKIMLFGDPGVGKTRLAASAHLVEEMKPILYGSAEAGLLTLDALDGFDDMHTVDLVATPKNDQNPEAVLNNVEAFFDLAQSGDYKTIVIDTLSEVQRYGLMYLADQPSGWQGVMSPKKTTLPTYGSSLVQTGVLVRSFRDLGLNLIMTCHARRAHLETDGHDYIVPSLTGQQWKDVVAIFDEVWYLYTKAARSLNDPEEGARHRAIFRPFENLKTKDRYLGLPTSLDITDQGLDFLLHYKEQ